LRRGERLFDFYDTCARHGYDEFRDIVNTWISEFPESDRNELITRCKKGGNRDFQDALCELTTHALLRRLGHDVTVHPELKNSQKRPDFAIADKKGQLIAYVEVKTINPPSEEEGATQRENDVYNAIDEAQLPAGCLLGFGITQAGASTPKLGALVADVEDWAKANVEAAQKKERISKEFVVGDWKIELDLVVGSSKEPPKHAIGNSMGNVGFISPHDDLKKALSAKARRYGPLDAPYLIVVADAKGQLFGAEHIREAVVEAILGDDLWQITQAGVVGVKRAKNGFWKDGPNGINQNVSGVLLFPDTQLWALRSDEHQPILAVNPWAAYPLPETMISMPRFSVEGDEWKFFDGKPLADILDLPNPWPPVESA
jgi:hypothetical protein